jgi:DNA-binding NarL/FixJ family response regulator
MAATLARRARRRYIYCVAVQLRTVAVRSHHLETAMTVTRADSRAATRVGRLRLMTMLATGATQESMASQLNVSLRSIQKEVEQTRRRLGATTAYTCGMLVVRQSLLPADLILDHARRRVRRFVEPTMRAYEVLRLLAAGIPDPKIAQELGMSESTVRRDLRHLTHANGIYTRVSAGALFEALQWHSRGHVRGDGSSLCHP